jgi:hypothetical protein
MVIPGVTDTSDWECIKVRSLQLNCQQHLHQHQQQYKQHKQQYNQHKQHKQQYKQHSQHKQQYNSTPASAPAALAAPAAGAADLLAVEEPAGATSKLCHSISTCSHSLQAILLYCRIAFGFCVFACIILLLLWQQQMAQ